MSSNPGRRRLLVVSIAAVVLSCAGLYWLSSLAQPEAVASPGDTTDPASISRHADDSRGGVPIRSSTPGVDSAAVVADADASPPLDSETEAVAAYAAEKYELLFEELGSLSPDLFAKINGALLRRELATGNAAQPDALAAADAEVYALLSPAQRATFDSLKDSDRELFQLNEYAGGVGNVAPLGANERKSILRTKLAYKGRFRQLVADSDLARQGLSAAEREHAYTVTANALERYRQDYLQEVRQYLSNDEQWQLLSNFETTEFTAEMDKLRAQAGS